MPNGDPGASLVGRQLGPYRIESRLGAGAMGEVYRAHDTQLGRDVAVKVLPHRFADDPDRLARFAREARLLAALNHPNIATIHGVLEMEGVPALVMELVEGPTLADKLASAAVRQSGLPLEEALRVGRQILDALEAAHDKGIIHRDLKPANLKFSRADQIKALDFGLAKALSVDADGGDVTELPTMSVGATRAGTIVGTPAYMSPEQARGQPLSKSADIWAFGCVLYEMLTGRLAFPGATFSDTLAGVLERQPDWSALPAATPPNVRRVLARCLEKDQRRRWRDAGDIRIELDEAEGAGPAAVPAAKSPARRFAWIAWVALAVVSAGAAALVSRAVLRDASRAPEVRFESLFPHEMSPDFAQLAVSPDGRQVAAAPSLGGGQTRFRLWLRPLESTSGRTLPGTEGALFPFWSPDGSSLGFFADGKLKRLDLASEAVTTIADAPVPRGGAWQDDGLIMFAPNATGPLWRVGASGGQPVAVTQLLPGQNDHRAPVILPDRQHFLYYARGTAQARGVYVARLDGTETRRLLDAEAAAAYASGYVLFARQGVLLAQLFDAKRQVLGGSPFRVADRVSVNPGLSLASLSGSDTGTVAYSSGAIPHTQLTWFDRAGKKLETVGPADLTTVANPALSPDGSQVAFSQVTGGNWDIWRMDMHGVVSRFTSALTLDFSPAWSPDGRQIVFQSNNAAILLRPLTDSGPERVLWRLDSAFAYPSDVSPDGRVLLFTRGSTSGGTTWSADLWYLSLVGEPSARAFVSADFDERDGQFSPDGKWVAYQSNESGRFEIYIRPFPGPGERIQVSVGGGEQARWARTGELFYITADQQLAATAVTFSANGSAKFGQPVLLFRTGLDKGFQARPQYVVSPDAQRFLLNTPTDTVDPTSIQVILNWTGRN